MWKSIKFNGKNGKTWMKHQRKNTLVLKRKEDYLMNTKMRVTVKVIITRRQFCNWFGFINFHAVCSCHFQSICLKSEKREKKEKEKRMKVMRPITATRGRTGQKSIGSFKQKQKNRILTKIKIIRFLKDGTFEERRNWNLRNLCRMFLQFHIFTFPILHSIYEE